MTSSVLEARTQFARAIEMERKAERLSEMDEQVYGDLFWIGSAEMEQQGHKILNQLVLDIVEDIKGTHPLEFVLRDQWKRLGRQICRVLRKKRSPREMIAELDIILGLKKIQPIGEDRSVSVYYQG
jgi:hypothetical protein